MSAPGGRVAASPLARRLAAEQRIDLGGLTGSGPAGAVIEADVVAAAADGASVYNGACMACHASGAAGAPKVGDAAAWQPRVAQGLDTLVNHAINGKGAMPPKAGSPSLTDAEIRAAIDYMVGASK